MRKFIIATLAILSFMSMLVVSKPPFQQVETAFAGGITNACALDADALIVQNNLPLSIRNKDGAVVYINKEILSKRGYVAYGNPFGSTNGGERRYLGYTIDGTVYTNPDYPPDVEVQYHVGKSWTKEPWMDPVARKKLTETWGISGDGYNDATGSDQWLKARLVSPYPSRPYNWLEDFNTLPNNSWRSIKFPWDVSDLKTYGVIVSPPKKYVWGTYVMFNTGSGRNDGINAGGTWYQDFLIQPDVLFCGGGNERDLFVSYLEGGQYETGTPKTTRVRVGLSQTSDIDSLGNVKVSLTANGSTVGTQTISLQKGEEKSLTFRWTPSGNGDITLKAEVNPEPRFHTEYWQKPGDVYANNVISTTLHKAAEPELISGCNRPNSNYSRGVSGIYYYSCPPCDEDGCSTCIGYYYEELWVDMEKAQPSVVKAGQGTEITFKTSYDNDNPAHYRRLYGGTTAILQAPNTDNWPSVRTERQALVPKSTPGSWNNIWNAPFAKFDGEGNWTKYTSKPTINMNRNEFGGLQRWYFGFDVPDGETFSLTGHVTAGYRDTLTACDTTTVTIKGSPFDDFVVRVVDPTNPFPTGDVGVNWRGYDTEDKFYDYTDRIHRLTRWYEENK